MKSILLLSCILVFTLTGCEKRVNASNLSSFRDSIDSMKDDLPDDKYIAFDIAIHRLIFKASEMVDYTNISTEDIDKLYFESLQKIFDGKTIDEIIKESEQWAKEKNL